MARGVAGECNYCPEPADPGAGCSLCLFHADWEAACNVVEDECCGMIVGQLVVNQMHAWGWAPEAIDRGLGREPGRPWAVEPAEPSQADRDEVYVGLGDFDGS